MSYFRRMAIAPLDSVFFFSVLFGCVNLRGSRDSKAEIQAKQERLNNNLSVTRNASLAFSVGARQLELMLALALERLHCTQLKRRAVRSLCPASEWISRDE